MLPSLRYTIAALPWLLTGCIRAPSFDVAGSLFPAWLACLTLGILLATVCHWFLARLKVTLVAPVLVYPSLAALFAFSLWLLFFR